MELTRAIFLRQRLEENLLKLLKAYEAEVDELSISGVELDMAAKLGKLGTYTRVTGIRVSLSIPDREKRG